MHNRCVEIGKRFNIPIITKSTFNNRLGSVINDKIEDTKVKSIVKNDNIILVTAKQEMYTPRMINRIYRKLLDNNIFINNIINKSTSNLEIQFTIKSAEFNKFENVITSQYPKLDCSYKNISKISIIGYGIMNDRGELQPPLYHRNHQVEPNGAVKPESDGLGKRCGTGRLYAPTMTSTATRR